MKNTKKDSKKNHANDIKIYLKKKKIKDEKRLDKDIKILLKKKKKKRHQYYLKRYLNVLLYTFRRDIICETFAEFIFMFLYPRAYVLQEKKL